MREMRCSVSTQTTDVLVQGVRNQYSQHREEVGSQECFPLHVRSQDNAENWIKLPNFKIHVMDKVEILKIFMVKIRAAVGSQLTHQLPRPGRSSPCSRRL